MVNKKECNIFHRRKRVMRKKFIWNRKKKLLQNVKSYHSTPFATWENVMGACVENDCELVLGK